MCQTAAQYSQDFNAAVAKARVQTTVYEVATASLIIANDSAKDNPLCNTPTPVGAVSDNTEEGMTPSAYEVFNPSATGLYGSQYWSPGDTVEVIYEQIDSYINTCEPDLKTQKKLGEGEFGIVYKGEWKQLGRETVPAALKTLKPTASNDERLKLLREAAIMGQFNHPHIVKLYGVVKDIQAPIMIMEFLPKGELRNYLLEIKEDLNRCCTNSTVNI
jgi:serine/threonine protein kinase